MRGMNMKRSNGMADQKAHRFRMDGMAMALRIVEERGVEGLTWQKAFYRRIKSVSSARVCRIWNSIIFSVVRTEGGPRNMV